MRVVPKKVTPPKRKYHDIRDPETGEIPFSTSTLEDDLVRLGLIQPTRKDPA